MGGVFYYCLADFSILVSSALGLIAFTSRFRTPIVINIHILLALDCFTSITWGIILTILAIYGSQTLFWGVSTFFTFFVAAILDIWNFAKFEFSPFLRSSRSDNQAEMAETTISPYHPNPV